jgi:hypothetical protein
MAVDVRRFFRQAPGVNCMLGPLDAQPKVGHQVHQAVHSKCQLGWYPPSSSGSGPCTLCCLRSVRHLPSVPGELPPRRHDLRSWTTLQSRWVGGGQDQLSVCHIKRCLGAELLACMSRSSSQQLPQTCSCVATSPADLQEKQETDRIMEEMWDVLQHGRNAPPAGDGDRPRPMDPIPVADLVCNLRSFAQTMENLFSLSFLVRGSYSRNSCLCRQHYMTCYITPAIPSQLTSALLPTMIL